MHIDKTQHTVHNIVISAIALKPPLQVPQMLMGVFDKLRVWKRKQHCSQVSPTGRRRMSPSVTLKCHKKNPDRGAEHI